MDTEIKQIQQTLGIIKAAFNTNKVYAKAKEVTSMMNAIKKALEEIWKARDKFEQKTESQIKDVYSEIDNLKSEVDAGSKSHLKKMNAILDTTRNDIQNFREEVKDKISELGIDAMEKRHNEMEMEMAQHHENINNSLTQITGEITNIKNDLVTAKEEINNLIEDALKDIKDEISKVKSSKASTGGSRRVFQPYVDRFTTQTDGVTKTFYLSRAPLKTDTIKVWGTDFPIILDPSVDFTVTNRTLTLSANIPAPSEGATLIIEYFA